MRSRYTFMKEGSTIDSKTNSAFPDPLSLNYLDVQISELPKEDTYKVNSLENEPMLLKEKTYTFKPFELVTLFINK